MQNFSIKDYIRMGKAKGIRLPLQYFFQNHLFDIINGTDTHFRLDKKDYDEHPSSFDSGILYMSSVTCEIKNALKRIKENSGEVFNDLQFFDLGCGKGKSVLVYLMQYGNIAKHKAIGIEYYSKLAEIAGKNLQIIGKESQAIFAHNDAREYIKYISSDKLIIFLYNPFGNDVINEVLTKCQNKEVYIIYIDPAHHDTIISFGYNIIYSKTGPYPNRNTNIYYRRNNQ